MPGFIHIAVFFILVVNETLAGESALNAKQMLETMRKAMDSLNYQGTIVLYKNGKLDTMKLFHSFKNGVEQERLLSLNAPVREIIMDDDKIRCEFPGARTVVSLWPARQSFFMDLPENLDELDNFYLFSNAGIGEIAGMSSYIIDIKPKDNFRYARKIWLDQQSYLPLKYVLLDKSGMALEQVMFADLQIKDSIPIIKKTESKEAGIRQVYQFQLLPYQQTRFELDNIPPGFKRIFFTKRPMHNKDKLIEHLLLSDGFSSISVYLEVFEKDMSLEQYAVGAVNSYSRKLGGYLLTVMGEVPNLSVKFIAQGAKLRDGK